MLKSNLMSLGCPLLLKITFYFFSPFWPLVISKGSGKCYILNKSLTEVFCPDSRFMHYATYTYLCFLFFN